jgi:hypothetical protein
MKLFSNSLLSINRREIPLANELESEFEVELTFKSFRQRESAENILMSLKF